MADKQILIRLSEAEHDALKAFAGLTDRSMNDVARDALRVYLTAPERRAEAKTGHDQFTDALSRLDDQ